jgi:hypothetical protein
MHFEKKGGQLTFQLLKGEKGEKEKGARHQTVTGK